MLSVHYAIEAFPGRRLAVKAGLLRKPHDPIHRLKIQSMKTKEKSHVESLVVQL